MQESEKDLPLNDTERQQVRAALEAILATEKFDAAPQMSAFLRYVVEQAASGMQSRIKAFTVAVDALGKPDTFDPQNDPVVRVLAGRLRAALTTYHTEHPDVPLMIKMAPGSYVPIFEQNNTTAQGAAANPHSGELSATTHHEQETLSQPSAAVASSANPATQYHADNPATLHGSDSDNNGAYSADALPTGQSMHESSGYLGQLARKLSNIPTIALAGGLAAAVVIAIVAQNGTPESGEPDMRAASPAASDGSLLSNRSRPDHPSIFISAIDDGNKFENTLNALLSGVISENDKVRVYRILDKQSEIRFWPDEYILTISALDLPGEMRVNLQMIEAVTGKIIHSQAISLNDKASDQMTHDEIAELTDAARLVTSDKGPIGASF